MYVSVNEEKLLHDQLESLTEDNESMEIMKEYHKRDSIEAYLAKDADKIDQMLLVKEYAKQWVEIDKYRFKTKEVAVNRCATNAWKKLMEEVYDADPYEWRYSLDK